MRDRLTITTCSPTRMQRSVYRNGRIQRQTPVSQKARERKPELINKIKRRKYTDENEEPKCLVYFKLEKELPLIGRPVVGLRWNPRKDPPNACASF